MLRSFVFISYLFVTSCIDPYFKETPQDVQLLSVSGLISTDPGPHQVMLTMSNQYSDQTRGNRILVKNADVYIEDELGNVTNLTEDVLYGRWICVPGWIFSSQRFGVDIELPLGRYYTPDDFRAVVGRTYTLHINTAEGGKYKSKPETVLSVPKIENIQLRNTRVGTENPLVDSKDVLLTSKFTDTPNERNYYLWRVSHSIINLITEPHLAREDPAECCNSCYMPDIEAEKFFAVLSDDLFDGLATEQPAIHIPDDGIRFKSRYKLQLNQYAITEDAFRFLKLARQQLDLTGSVFDPPPANLRGNMINLNQPDQPVLGYFIAADVSSKIVYINKDDIPLAFRSVSARIPDDCRNYCGRLFEPPSIDPPDDWEFN